MPGPRDQMRMRSVPSARRPAAVVGTGINPGFVFDLLIVALTGVCSEIESITASRVNDLSAYGPSVLAAQGVGNMLCGFLGALPMTGVIVRSSANVEAGGKTRASAILHGGWLHLAASLLMLALLGYYLEGAYRRGGFAFVAVASVLASAAAFTDSMTTASLPWLNSVPISGSSTKTSSPSCSWA